jgi:2-methylcitrate dehydratase PrpD
MAVATGTGFTLPARVFAQTSGPGPVMSAARARALPADITENAKYHLLDTLAAMISGSELPPGKAAERYIREHGAEGAATVANFGLTAAPLDAALANGVTARADETDDSHNESRSHPGSVVPAALAAGEEYDIDGSGARVSRARHATQSRTEVVDKARDLTAPILGREKSDKPIESVFAIETITDIRSLRPLLQRR